MQPSLGGVNAGPDARVRVLGAKKKSATGDVALKITTKGGWRSVLNHRAVIQYINSFLNTELPVKP
jgi:hypothetical protein